MLLFQACSEGGHWLKAATSEVADSGPVLGRSLSQACSSGGTWLRPVSIDEFTVSGPLPRRSLTHTKVVLSCCSFIPQMPVDCHLCPVVCAGDQDLYEILRLSGGTSCLLQVLRLNAPNALFIKRKLFFLPRIASKHFGKGDN